jgi:Putative, 10TM heavy-metal exporter
MNPRAVLADALVITGFVFVMMLIVEYLNVATRGALRRLAGQKGLAAYAASSALGAAPGCLGSFAAVSLYIHGALSFGAIVANMIATSGDEAFVMLALFPRKALLLGALLFAYGILVGFLVDRVAPRLGVATTCCETGLTVHVEHLEVGLPLRPQALRSLSLQRATLVVVLALLALAVVLGAIGQNEKTWVRVTLLALDVVALWIVLTVPEHFLEAHLYDDVARRHVPRIFLWVLGVLVIMGGLEAVGFVPAEFVRTHRGWALIAAALVGVIPESGPHLVFVMLFAEGAIPFSVLATSSVVQDGHGMLPLLAESRREFVRVKVINLIAGLALGGALTLAGL